MQSFDWSAKQEPGEVEGNQVAPVGVTDGYGKGTGSFEMLLSDSDDFEAAITGGPGLFPLMSTFFQWTVQYSINTLAQPDITTQILRGIKITGVDHSGTKGSDPATVKYSMRFSQIIKNGIVLFGDPATP